MIGYELKTVISPKKQASFRQKTDANRNSGKYPNQKKLGQTSLLMKTFIEYSASFTITCNPGMLDFGANGLEYCIYEGFSPLLTPNGNLFSHPSEAVIRLLVTDLQLFDDLPLKTLSSPILYSFLKDAFTIDNDPFLHQWENLC